MILFPTILAALGQSSVSGGVELEQLVTLDVQGPANDRATAVAVAGSTAYVAAQTTSPYGGGWSIAAHDTGDGSELWTVDIAPGPGDADDRPNGLAVSPDGSVIYVAGTLSPADPVDREGALFALDAVDGSLIWSTFFDDSTRAGDNGVTAVALTPDGTTLAVTGYLNRTLQGPSERMLVATVDAATGAILWEQPTDGGAPLDVAGRGVDLAFSPDGGRLFTTGELAQTGTPKTTTLAFGTGSGTELWSQIAGPSTGEASQPFDLATDGDLVVVVGLRGSPVGGGPTADSTFAYDSSTGAQAWSTSGALDDDATASTVVEPAGSDFLIAEVSSLDNDVRVARIDGASGSRLWESALNLVPTFLASASISTVRFDPSTDSVLVVGTRSLNSFLPQVHSEGFTLALDAATGLPQWTAFTAPDATLDDTLTAAALAGDRLIEVGASFIPIEGDDRRVGGRRISDGALLFDSLGASLTTAASYGLAAVLDENSGDLFTLGRQAAVANGAAQAARIDGESGAVLWTYTDALGTATGGRLDAGVLGADGSALFATGTDGQDLLVCALDATSGALLWRTTVDGPANLLDAGRDIIATADGSSVYVGGAVDVPPGAPVEQSPAAIAIALDASVGTERWRATHDPDPGFQRFDRLALSADGARLVALEENPLYFQVEVVAFDSQSGSQDWAAALRGGGDAADNFAAKGVDVAFAPDGSALWVLGGSSVPFAAQFAAQVWRLDPGTGAVTARSIEALPIFGNDVRAGAIDASGSSAAIVGASGSNGSGAVTRFDLAGLTANPTQWYGSGPATEFLDVTFDDEGETVFAGGVFDAFQLTTVAIDFAGGELLWQSDFEFDASALLATQLDGVEAVLHDDDRRRLWSVGSGVLLGSKIDAVVQRHNEPTLLGDPAFFIATQGGQQPLRARAGSDLGGLVYLLLGSASGSAPGFAVDGLALPLNPDGYFLFTLTEPDSQLLPSSLGNLDGGGQALLAFNLPPGASPSIAGLELHHAFVVIDASPPGPGVVHASNAVPVTIL